MGILSIIFQGFPREKPEDFDKAKYEKELDESVSNFEKKYDLSNTNCIRSITKEDAKLWGEQAPGVPSLPEQVLFKKATEHKKNGNLDLAIECLKKANEFMPISQCQYFRSDYERLVNYLVDAGRFQEARNEHNKLDKQYGSNLEHLERIKRTVSKTKDDAEKYDEKVIEPQKKEERDREEYYWLLENMKSIAPKSFGGYRRMKEKNTENYQKLLVQAADIGHNLSEVLFWQQ